MGRCPPEFSETKCWIECKESTLLNDLNPILVYQAVKGTQATVVLPNGPRITVKPKLGHARVEVYFLVGHECDWRIWNSNSEAEANKTDEELPIVSNVTEYLHRGPFYDYVVGEAIKRTLSDNQIDEIPLGTHEYVLREFYKSRVNKRHSHEIQRRIKNYQARLLHEGKRMASYSERIDRDYIENQLLKSLFDCIVGEAIRSDAVLPKSEAEGNGIQAILKTFDKLRKKSSKTQTRMSAFDINERKRLWQPARISQLGWDCIETKFTRLKLHVKKTMLMGIERHIEVIFKDLHKRLVGNDYEISVTNVAQSLVSDAIAADKDSQMDEKCKDEDEGAEFDNGAIIGDEELKKMAKFLSRTNIPRPIPRKRKCSFPDGLGGSQPRTNVVQRSVSEAKAAHESPPIGEDEYEDECEGDLRADIDELYGKEAEESDEEQIDYLI